VLAARSGPSASGTRAQPGGANDEG